MIRRKPKRRRLIDDSALALSRDRSRRLESKPQAWWRSEEHRDFIRSLGCMGKRASYHSHVIDPAHVRLGTDGAGSEKPSDYFIVPLCRECHRRQHELGEETFWVQNTAMTDPIKVALQIAMSSPCEETRVVAEKEWKRRYE